MQELPNLLDLQNMLSNDQENQEIQEHLQPTSFEDAQNEPGRVVPAIEFRNVYLSFDDQKILNGISFKVKRGETKIILGRSGGGKSTTIRLLLGLLKPDSGQIFVDGEDITTFSETEMMRVRQKMGMVFQEGALFDSLSVYDNVAYRLHEQGVAEDEVEREVRRMLMFVDLEDAIEKMPSELSGGMRRRVGIARACWTPSARATRPPLSAFYPACSSSLHVAATCSAP